ncbi:MAG: hypothetical protein QM802_20045 [Agriterribacter sp.]
MRKPDELKRVDPKENGEESTENVAEQASENVSDNAAAEDMAASEE